MRFLNIFSKERKEKLDNGLEKTKKSFLDKLSHAVVGKSTIDDDVLDSLEETLLTSDVGVDTTLEIINRIKTRVARDKYVGIKELNRLLCEEIADMLSQKVDASEVEDIKNSQYPYVILVVGVNGVGKTTTIAKLANLFKKSGLKVMLGAAVSNSELPLQERLLLILMFCALTSLHRHLTLNLQARCSMLLEVLKLLTVQ